MKKLLAVLFIVTALGTGLFGRFSMNAQAEEETVPTKASYYTSVQIQYGDSLWSIANEYCDPEVITREKYVDELRKMNRLSGDGIHAGEYLTVVYYQ